MRLLAALGLVTILAACGDLDVRSIRVPDVVPANLEGEWSGQWASTRAGGGSGTVTLRMQDFGGDPVVSISLDNPCIEARPYRFRTEGNLIELLSDDVVLFSAALEAEARTLTGTYSCPADGGVWSVHWSRELTPLRDVGGSWTGSVTVPGFPPQMLELQLDLVVQGGALVVVGSAQVPSLSTTVLPLSGFVRFSPGDTPLPADDEFDIELLAPTAEGDVGILLRGDGLAEDPRVTTGLVLTNDPALPFTQGSWQAQRIGP